MNIHRAALISVLVLSASPAFAQRGGEPQAEFVRQAQQLVREGKLDEALARYKEELAASPGSVAANNGAGVVLDLLGRTAEAKTYFARAIEAAPTPAAKANAQRSMAMSYGFDGDCRNTVKYEQMVFDYWVAMKDAYQQGEMLNEAARVCIDSGDFDTAQKMYIAGRDAGLRSPTSPPTAWPSGTSAPSTHSRVSPPGAINRPRPERMSPRPRRFLMGAPRWRRSRPCSFRT
jgi:hypothetical protein